MSLNELTEKWENFVNSYIFANFKNLEIWYVKRETGDNNMIYNYIRFPKAENGKQLNRALVEYIIQSIEADESICKKIFGPAYVPGTADIQDNANDITIIWNKLSIDELTDIDYEDRAERERLIDLYKWDIDYELKRKQEAERLRPKRKDELTPEEIKRREKINKILRLLSIRLKDPKIAPENKSPENLEKCYIDFDWEASEDWDKIDDPDFLLNFVQRKYNQDTKEYEFYNPITLKWLNIYTKNWVDKLHPLKKSKWY